MLVRYADDALVMCKSRGQVEAALARLTVLLAETGLKPKAARTLWVPEGASWVLSCGYVGEAIGPR